MAVEPTSAAPRPAVPPLPENYLNKWDFNGTSWLTNARSAPLAALNVEFVDSWSDQALHMAGPDRALLALAERAADGMLNLPMNAPGTFRFYFSPAWSSASAGGTGPGVEARLMEVGAWSGQEQVGWWSLSVDPSGTWVRFAAQHAGGVRLRF